MDRLLVMERDVIRVIGRARDTGGGWKEITASMWPLVRKYSNEQAVEVDEKNKKARLTEAGKLVFMFLQ